MQKLSLYSWLVTLSKTDLFALGWRRWHYMGQYPCPLFGRETTWNFWISFKAISGVPPPLWLTVSLSLWLAFLTQNGIFWWVEVFIFEEAQFVHVSWLVVYSTVFDHKNNNFVWFNLINMVQPYKYAPYSNSFHFHNKPLGKTFQFYRW